MLKRFLFFIPFLISINTYCQDNSVSVETSYTDFLGLNHWAFKPTISYSLEYNYGGFIFGIGYMNFKPQRDTLYFADESLQGYGTIAYENYWVVPVYMGGEFTTELNDKWSIKPGVHFGYSIVNYYYDLRTSNHRIGEAYQGGKVGFSLRNALAYRLSDDIEVFFLAKYNAMVEITSVDKNRVYASGAYHHYMTYGIGVSYIFE